MTWHEIKDPADPELDRLAAQYNIHPLHIEDCRHRNQAAKLEEQNGYLFVVLKPVEMNAEYELEIDDLDVFIGSDWVITVQESNCESVCRVLDRARGRANGLRPDEVLHRIADELVDSYLPLLDRVNDRIDEVEDEVLECADQRILEGIFTMKRALIEIRRVLANTRDVLGHILRLQGVYIAPAMQPFFRDVYDHVARNLDSVEIQRDLLTGTMDIYLSSVSNRTNQTMKVLAVISTITLPSIIISGIYGMNLRHLPWADHPHAWGIVTGLIATVCVVLIALLRWFRWI